MTTYAFPTFGMLPVGEIDTGLTMKVIEPLWTQKTETASRLRGRIEAILDWAATRGLRSKENPARWKGHLENLLPAKTKVRPVVHHRALPYGEIGGFVDALRQRPGVAARALEFLILTAARSNEVIGARWPEIDLDNRLWVVAAERMKGKKQHRVPLAAAACAVLDKMAAIRDGDDGFVFPGPQAGRPLSNMALLVLLGRMGHGDLTSHGFRSTFADWGAERTSFPMEVREMALAHTVANKVEAACRRLDLFEKRRQLAEAWARFCSLPLAAAAVVPLRRVRR